MHNDKTTAIKNWFGKEFDLLHPQLQKLHLSGGTLSGGVSVSYGRGIAGLLGKRLAKKMNLPDAGVHELTVDISHHEDGLHWYRRFGKSNPVRSIFTPVGYKGSGYWRETLGAVTMKLDVEVCRGAWYWRCIGISLYGCPIPLWLAPRLRAYKSVEQQNYRFHVDFSLPGLGLLVAYEGLLQAEYVD